MAYSSTYCCYLVRFPKSSKSANAHSSSYHFPTAPVPTRYRSDSYLSYNTSQMPGHAILFISTLFCFFSITGDNG